MGKDIIPAKHIIGEITVSPDKSISHRAAILGAMALGKTYINNFSLGKDCIATIKCLEGLGIEYQAREKSLVVYGKGIKGFNQPTRTLDAHNSGTTIRMMAGVLAGQGFTSVITGDESLVKRPMMRVIAPLTLMGANINHQGGKAPLTIIGSKLKGIDYQMEVSSAQVKSSILLAALTAEGGTVVREHYATRDHTERMIKYMGGDINVRDNNITLNPKDRLQNSEIKVVGDISSAAFFIVAALIMGKSELIIKNVGINDTRMGLVNCLRSMGGEIDIQNKRLVSNEPVADICIKSSNLKGIEIQGKDVPTLIDEIPILAVAAAFAQGKTIIREVGELRFKESNRLEAIIKELSKMGVNIWSENEDLYILGGQPLKGANLNSYNDHRIAMALTIAALSATSPSIVQGWEWVGISYPEFYKTLDNIIK